MKILFIRAKVAEDYLYDSLLHGLRDIEDVELWDYPRISHMYRSEFGSGKRDLNSLYGRGFTLFGTLSDVEYDRQDIWSKIQKNYFSFVIIDESFSTIYPEIFDTIKNNFENDRIIIVDGEDHFNVRRDLCAKYRYFKRELRSSYANVFPISFGFPAEKIRHKVAKTKAVAFVDPRNRETYIHNTEEEYYRDYNESLFGISISKAGWDCMRHYEIIGARSVPWFLDLDKCPDLTCTTLPKAELLEVRKLIEIHGAETFLSGSLYELYDELREKIYIHFINNCTSVNIAKKVIDTIQNNKLNIYIPSWNTLENDLAKKTYKYPEYKREDIYQLFERAPEKLLDIGCASGAVAHELKRRLPNLWAWGCELDMDAAKIAATRLDYMCNEPLSEWSEENKSMIKNIDTILMLDVLEHMYNPWHTLKILAEMISSDTQIIISLPNIGNITVLIDLANGSWSYKNEGILDVTHIRFFTLNEMRKMFYQCGYRIEFETSLSSHKLIDLDNIPPMIDCGSIKIPINSREQALSLCTVQFGFRLKKASDSSLNDNEYSLRYDVPTQTFT